MEPLDLAGVEGVGEGDVVGGGAVGGVDAEGHGLANLELGAEKVDLVVGLDLLVVGGVREGEGKHTLLLQVGLVDTSEGAGDDSETAKVAGLESGVLTGRALTVVPVTDDDPPDALALVVTGGGGHSVVLAVGEVADLVGLAVVRVDGTDQHVVGDVVKVTAVLEPGTGHGDVVGGGLALGLDQDGKIAGVLAIPGVERLKELETVRGGRDLDVDRGAVGGRGLICVLARTFHLLAFFFRCQSLKYVLVTVGGKTITSRLLEHELVAVLVLEGVGERVEVQGAGKRHGDNEIGRGDEGVSGRVGVVTASEVTVVGGDDGVRGALPVRELVKVTHAHIQELILTYATSRRSHWPMQGPQALARTMPPKSSRVLS